MQKQRGTKAVPSVLQPTVPQDIGARSQRARIIDAMVDSCAEKTYPATTIADIVRRASISRTTFYKRFADKRQCFDAAIDACVEELREAAVAAHFPTDQPTDSMRKATVAMLGLMAAKPGLAQLVVGEATAVEPAIIGRYRKLLLAAIERLWDASGQPWESRADPRLAFGRAQVLIFNLVATGEAAALADLLPEIVYIAVLPFAGHEEAIRQAQLAGRAPAADELQPVTP
jgi:AcrR family transcriptional regulator